MFCFQFQVVYDDAQLTVNHKQKTVHYLKVIV